MAGASGAMSALDNPRRMIKTYHYASFPLLMKEPTRAPALSRRERQIMDAVYRMGSATAREIRDALPEPPHAAAVRTMLRILESKGHLKHTADGPRHVYQPTTPRNVAQKSAMRHLVSTFFNGSRAAAMAALFDDGERPLSAVERDELAKVVKALRTEGQ